MSLTIDNPNGNTLYSNNTFGFILGGLFIDGGYAPNLAFIFSQDVRLVEFEIANVDSGESFDLVQGGVQSLGQSVSSFGTFSFANITDVFLANQAISSTHSNHNGTGYSISSITVDAIPEPASMALIGLVATGIYFKRRFFIA